MALALIAGQGGVPPYLVQRLLARGEVPLICEVTQFPSEVTGDLPRLGVRLEGFGGFLAELQARGITRLCMAGALPRPAVDPARIEAGTMPYIPRLQGAMAKGDDGLLREIMTIFEEAGITVIGAADLAPEVLPEPGVPTGTLPEASRPISRRQSRRVTGWRAMTRRRPWWCVGRAWWRRRTRAALMRCWRAWQGPRAAGMAGASIRSTSPIR